MKPERRQRKKKENKHFYYPPVRKNEIKIYCIKCKKKIYKKENAIKCHSCQNQQHLSCNPGISYELFQEAKLGQINVAWHCANCPTNSGLGLEEMVDDPSLNSLQSLQSDSRLEEVNDNHQNLNTSSENDWSPHPLPQNNMVSSRISGEFLPPASSSMVQDNLSIYIGDLGSYQEPDILHEATLQPQVPQPNFIPYQEQPITYKLVERGSIKGNDILCDSLGYKYYRKKDSRIKPENWIWICNHQKKGSRCRGRILTRNGEKSRAGIHTCSPKYKPELRTEIYRDLREQGLVQRHRSGQEMAEEYLINLPEDNMMEEHNFLPSVVNLQATINHHRRRNFPAEPKQLDFDLDFEFIEGQANIPANFVRKDIHCNSGSRHIILASAEMLQLMHRAFTWFCDGTFKVVKKPFYQLFSIHVFVKSGDSLKQVPVAFIMMSSRTKDDYISVFQELLNLLPENPCVQRVVTDFESAVWGAVNEVLPNVEQKGCLFHFTQAIFRKIKRLGLQTAYEKDPGTSRILKSLMGLPFIPQEYIVPVFNTMEQDNKCKELQKFFAYMKKYWIESRIFAPKAWCWFRELIRTNNDVEGWHNRFNRRVKNASVPFYVLLLKLGMEAQVVNLNCHLVQRNEMVRRTKKGSRIKQEQLMQYWEEFRTGECSLKKILQRACELISPSNYWETQVDPDAVEEMLRD